MSVLKSIAPEHNLPYAINVARSASERTSNLDTSICIATIGKAVSGQIDNINLERALF